MAHPGTLLSYDHLEYTTAWKLQQAMVEDRLAGRRPDTLLLLEHEPVFTIGRTGQDAHWHGSEAALRGRGYAVHRVERGGSVTFHGPGQIVGYPILRLDSFCSGPRTYMRKLEEVLIRTLAEWGLEGRRLDKRTGVWVGPEPGAKIAAMGVRIIRGVTMHGFALNVTVDLAPFAHIVPCGIAGCQVTSMAALLGRPVDRQQVRRRIGDVFAEVFGLHWTDRLDRSGEVGRPGSMAGRLPGQGGSARAALTPAAG